MIDLLPLVASCAAGAVLGVLFFWGLWATVCRLGRGRHTAAWMIGGFAVRFAILLAGFYLLARHAGWQHMLSAALGFTLARTFVVRRLRSETMDRQADT